MAKVLQFQSQLTCKENDQAKTFLSNVVEVQVLPQSTVVRPKPFVEKPQVKRKKGNSCAALFLLLFLR